MSCTRFGWTACLAAGALALAFATGAAGAGKAYVANFKDNTISVIDTGTAAIVATIPVAAGPHGMVATPDQGVVFVSGDGSAEVDAIDTRGDRVIERMTVGKTPHGLAMMPRGNLMLVAVYGEDRVAFVDTATRKEIGSVAVARPHTIAIRPDGKTAYVSSQQPGAFALVVIDVEARTVARRLPLDKAPRDIEFAHDGRALYFTIAGANAVSVLDPASDKVVAEIPTGASPHIASFFRGMSAGTVVVQGPGELQLFDPATNAPLRAIAVGKQPHWMASADDGKRIYVTNEGSDDVTVVDPGSGTTRTIAVGHGPRKIVVVTATGAQASAPAGVSIANFAFAPAQIVVAPGTTVTWRNDDGAPHGLAFNDGRQGADVLLPGAAFSRTYGEAGTFDYVCAVHPYMTGKVVVRAP